MFRKKSRRGRFFRSDGQSQSSRLSKMKDTDRGSFWAIGRYAPDTTTRFFSQTARRTASRSSFSASSVKSCNFLIAFAVYATFGENRVDEINTLVGSCPAFMIWRRAALLTCSRLKEDIVGVAAFRRACPFSFQRMFFRYFFRDILFKCFPRLEWLCFAEA